MAREGFSSYDLNGTDVVLGWEVLSFRHVVWFSAFVNSTLVEQLPISDRLEAGKTPESIVQD